MAPSGQSRRLRPRDIRFTQDSIGSRFADGTYLSDTFEQILNGRISVDELEWIEVVVDKELYWALTGNRRLYLYRKLEDLGEVSTIPVRKMSLSDYRVSRRFDDRNTTTCDGLDVEMRQPQAERYINRAIERWKKSRLLNRNLNEVPGVHGSRHLPMRASSSRRPPFFAHLDPNHFSRTGDRMGLVREDEDEDWGHGVVTRQPRRSTHPVRGSSEAGDSCCSCWSCCF